MPVRPERDGLIRHLRDAHRPLHRRAACIGDAVAVRPDLGAVAVLEVDDATRDLQERRDVGRGEVFALAEPEEKGRTTPGDDDCLGVARRDHGDGKCALQLRNGLHGRGKERIARLAMLGDEVRDHLRIGVGTEFVAGFLQALADRLVVLDDAVVHEGDVARHMRMRIALGRRAVRRPPGVRDAGRAADVLRLGLRGELGHAARGADPFNGPVVDDRDARGVVAAVLEAPQPLDEDRNDVAPRGGADDAAHVSPSLSSSASRPGSRPGGRVPA